MGTRCLYPFGVSHNKVKESIKHLFLETTLAIACLNRNFVDLVIPLHSLIFSTLPLSFFLNLAQGAVCTPSARAHRV